MFRRALLIVLVCLVQSACEAREPGIDVGGAVIREPLPGRTTTVAYFTLTNHSSTTVTLAGARTPFAETVEMHTHERDGEVVRMRPLDTLDIAPDEVVEFASGGHHLMAFGVAHLPAAVPVTLEFSDDSTKVVEFQRVSITGEDHK